jgi:hypothetical protein
VSQDKFTFTVTDIARFLGKSPVTLRGWERNNLISFPRDSGGDRKLDLADVRKAAQEAHGLGRINQDRLRLVEACVTMLEVIEERNK